MRNSKARKSSRPQRSKREALFTELTGIEDQILGEEDIAILFTLEARRDALILDLESLLAEKEEAVFS